MKQDWNKALNRLKNVTGNYRAQLSLKMIDVKMAVEGLTERLNEEDFTDQPFMNGVDARVDYLNKKLEEVESVLFDTDFSYELHSNVRAILQEADQDLKSVFQLISATDNAIQSIEDIKLTRVLHMMRDETYKGIKLEDIAAMKKKAEPMKTLGTTLQCEDAKKMDKISKDIFELRHQFDTVQEYLDEVENAENDNFLKGCQKKLDEMVRAIDTIETRLFDEELSSLVFSNYGIQIEEASQSVKRAFENMAKILPALKSHKQIQRVQNSHAKRKTVQPSPASKTAKKILGKPGQP